MHNVSLKMADEGNIVENTFNAIKIEVENDMFSQLTGSPSSSLMQCYGNNCLFCMEVTESSEGGKGRIPTLPGSSGNDLVNQDLWALFVLRHLLDLPVRNIATLLQTAEGKSISEWFMLCDTCKRTTREALDVYYRILRLKTDFKSLQTVVKHKIRTSVQSGNENDDICEEIRNYFIENDSSFHELLPKVERNINSPSNDDNTDDEYDDYNDDYDPLFIPYSSTTSNKQRLKRQRAKLENVHLNSDQQSNCSSENIGNDYELTNDSICDDEEYKQKRKKENDSRTDNEVQLEFRCRICLSNRQFRESSSFLKHMKLHEKSKSSCPKCNYPCLNRYTLKRHLRNNNCNPGYDFKCDMCDFVSQRSCNLIQHKKAKHNLEEPQLGNVMETDYESAQDNVDGDDENEPITRTDNVVKPKFHCKICRFDRHFRSSSVFARHMRKHEQGSIICPKCNYPCQNKSALRKHLRNNKCNPSYDFKCDMCDFVSDRSCNLIQHKKAKHNLEEPQPGNVMETDNEVTLDSVDEDDEIEANTKRRKRPDYEVNTEFLCKICRFERHFRSSSVFARHMRKHDQCSITCPKCNYPCQNESILEKHLNNNKCNPSYDFKCDMCDFVSERSCNLIQHKAAKHTSKDIQQKMVTKIENYEQELNCSENTAEEYQSSNENAEEEEEMKSKTTKRNVDKSDNNVMKSEFHCQICLFDRQFRNSSALARHMRHHELYKSSCPRCKFPCLNESSVERHLRKNKCKPCYEFKCDMCDFVSERSCNLIQHKAAKHTTEDLQSDMMTETEDGQGRKKTTQKIKTVYNCDICGLRTKNKQKFSSHLKQHQYFENCEEIDGKLKCKVCGELTGGSYELRRHTRENHSSELGISVFQCSMCDKTFSHQDSMQDHIAKVHNNECRFSCEICEFKTMKKSSLLCHMQCHGNEKTFICDLCAAPFKSEHSFRTHMRKVHNPSRRNFKFRCKYCNVGDTVFLNRSLLNRHMKDIHKELYVHKCDQCENSYLSAQSLQLHKNIIHNDGETECQFCQVKVLSSYYLYQHYQKSCKKKPPGFKFKPFTN